MRGIITVFFRKACVFLVFWTYFSLLFLAVLPRSTWWIASTLLAAVVYGYFQWTGRKLLSQATTQMKSDKQVPAYLEYGTRTFSHYYEKPMPRLVVQKIPIFSAAIRSNGLMGFDLMISENFLQLKREEQLPILEIVIRQFEPLGTQVRSLQIQWDNAFGRAFEVCPEALRFFVFLLFYPISRIALSFLSINAPMLRTDAESLPEKLANQRAILENDRWRHKNFAYFWSDLVIWPQKNSKKDIDRDFIPRLMSAFRFSVRTGQSTV